MFTNQSNLICSAQIIMKKKLHKEAIICYKLQKLKRYNSLSTLFTLKLIEITVEAQYRFYCK